jgi:hypothetical protein
MDNDFLRKSATLAASSGPIGNAEVSDERSPEAGFTGFDKRTRYCIIKFDFAPITLCTRHFGHSWSGSFQFFWREAGLLVSSRFCSDVLLLGLAFTMSGAFRTAQTFPRPFNELGRLSLVG